MNTVVTRMVLPAVQSPIAGALTELERRQPQLASAARLFLLAAIPCLIAMMVDPRTVNDVSGWIKPAKFFVSLSLYFATLAWYFGYLPETARRTRAGGFVIWAAIIAGVLEMTWMVAAAINGAPSHFNRAVIWRTAYSAAGVGALTLMIAVLVQGVLLARDREVRIAPAFRLSLVLAATISFAATVFIAMTLASSNGHWIGGARSDAGGLPLLGWSRTGGDLRVAHFWALHAHQLIPLAGWLVVRTGIRWERSAVLAFTVAFVGLIVFTYVQALQGLPFIP
ncbi:MAG: hypothetical protein ACREV5_12235 [Steroidobacter sp.]